MNYSLFIKPSAKKELLELPNQYLKKIDSVILSLQHSPRTLKTVKLEGYNFYRIRAGDYRIIYSIDDKNKKVDIMKIGHRREIYR
jgi:mRNA interferase RelE/StbE